MQAVMQTRSDSIPRALAVGFGTTTLMWLCSYAAILQPGSLAGDLIFLLTLVVLVIGGGVAASMDKACTGAGRATRRGIEVGFISAVINLLLVGSLLGSGMAFLWCLGLFASSMVLGGLGGRLAWMGGFGLKTNIDAVNWPGAFTAVCACLTFLMLVSGGIVTGFEAGLAVPDWPNSYGHNMLLYPLSEMVENLESGIFYEHAHRLTGMFVGLASMTLCAVLWTCDRRMSVRLGGTLILLMVIGQGVLGGLRVTGVLTLSDDPDILSPSTALGVVHGVFGQVVFGGLVYLAAVTSWTWMHGPASKESPGARAGRILAWWLLLLLLLQLVIGAVYRHLAMDLAIEGSRTGHILMGHIALAAIVMLLAIINGIRGMSTPAGKPILHRIGLALLILVVLQVLLGIAAPIIVLGRAPDEPIPAIEVVITSAHQANGGLLLAASVLMVAWQRRLEKSQGD